VDDIPLLADHFLRGAAAQRGAEPKVLSDAAVEAMRAYAWPGNVRELENAMERAMILATGPVVEVGALPERVLTRAAPPLAEERAIRNPTLELVERAYIFWVLQQEQGNKTRAAEALGIDPSTLHRKLARYEGMK
jgi:two-component system response regulator HydG